MTVTSGPLARLDRERDELAKAWLVRLIERASLDEIRELPTDRIARELPELIGDLLRACAADGGEQGRLPGDAAARTAALVQLRRGREGSVGELALDIAALQAVIIRRLDRELGDGDRDGFGEAVERLAEVAGALQAAAVEELLRARSRELESQANTDPLTGLWNLRYLQRQIGHLLHLQRRYEHPFAVLLMDIDGLKRINDAHGHQAGDRVLMQVAMSLRRSIRTVDTAARLGGDEFCVLAPEQDARSGAVLAERLAQATREDMLAPEAPPVALSIGVAACPQHGEEPDALIDAADRAMYRAKAVGDQVAVGGPGGDEVAEQAKR